MRASQQAHGRNSTASHRSVSNPPRAAAMAPRGTGCTCTCGGACPRCRSAPLSHPDDQLEREAQRAADAAMRLPLPAVAAPAGGGDETPLPAAVRAVFAPRLGIDLSNVRLHTGEAAAASAAALGARAYTSGQDIVFGRNRYAPHTDAGRHLIAHELTHVAQQARGASTQIQRDVEPAAETPLAVSGDRERVAPEGGVAIRNGTLNWRLHYVGRAGGSSVSGGAVRIVTSSDVEMNVTFTPATGAGGCPTISFIQIVRPTTGGLPDTARLLFIRDAAGFSADVGANETEPYYGLGAAAPGPGLATDMSSTAAGTAPGRSAAATFADAPVHGTSFIPPGQTTVREFEVAVICVQTGETFGSIRWGYEKTGAGVITLTGAQSADVQTTAATAEVESARQAFYAGFFQHSLSGFARGSAALTTAHRTELTAVAGQGMLRRIILAGSNDFSGGPEARAALSLERAQAARDFLVAHGVDTALIQVEGHGVTARVPNPAGRSVAANRRVDVHVERGMEGVAHGAEGSAAESMRLRRQNPRQTLDEFVTLLFELQRRPGRIPIAHCNQLTHLTDALARWHRLDTSVPDVFSIYGARLRALRGRCESPIPRAEFDLGPTPLPHRSFIPRIVESVEEGPF